MEHWPEAIELLLSVSPARWCQICFTLATCAVLGVAIAPPAERKLLVNYGARGHESAATSADKEPTRCEDDVFLRAVRKLTSLGQVPHSWFGTFYLVYIQCALFWAIQYITRGFVLQSIANQQVESGSSTSANGIQVVVAWCLMLFQAARRLYESWAFAKPSKSTMWIVHWLLGQLFYLGISVAIWIEGSDAILHDEVLSNARGLTADALLKIAVALPLFISAWVSQYRCHKYLAGLKKYSLPDLGMFRYLICPHYTCECVIYLSLAIVAAPEGQLCNTTLLSVLMFVAVNLGVTAHGSRSWYTERFGPEEVAGRRILIPWLY